MTALVRPAATDTAADRTAADQTAADQTASDKTAADPVDAGRHGVFRSSAAMGPAFGERLGSGRARFPAVAGRYHLYTAAPSPGAHRVEILRSLAGLDDVVSLSRVDAVRDGRGWAFRGATGPDPVNGFTLLRDAYDASTPGVRYSGRVDVPVLWDRVEGRIVSDDATTIGVDLATCFGTNRLYRVEDVDEIERIGTEVARSFTARLGAAATNRASAETVRDVLRRADRRLAESRYVLGESFTDADVRWWVAVARYDAGVNAHRTLGPALPAYRGLWRWARELYAMPAFASTTDFAAFAAPFADLSHWTS